MKTFTLRNGVSIPAPGFGTYSRNYDFTEEAIANALKTGYRHFDTATLYRDEDLIGSAIRRSGIPRSELFLTTKVWKTDMGYDRTLRSFEASCKKLQTDYLDLLLIHWPVPEYGPVNDPCRPEGAQDTPWEVLCRDTWRAMEKLYEEGAVRAIGVSNFLPHHLMRLSADAGVLPMVDQIEFHPGYTQQYTVDYCRAHSIVVEAWRPMAKQFLANEPLLLELAAQYERSVAQICIRFALQSGVLPLPSSKNPARMAENFNIFDFELSEYDMSRLSTLPQMAWSGQHPDRKRAPEG